MLMFAVCIGLIFYCCQIGLMNPDNGWLLSSLIVISCIGFYAALRSGWNQRFAEPSLTLPQILAALTWISGAYGATNEGHGGTLILVALVLVFGIFNMSTRDARYSALYAVLAIGVTILYKTHTDPQRYPAKVEWMYFIFLVTVVPMISQLAGQINRMRANLKAKKQALEEALVRIQELATHDELTGLVNRRHISQVLNEHAARSKRGVVKFWVAILDLDHFKRINDTYGHQVGDEVLRNFARLATDVLRETDVVGRWGGEEFLVVMLSVPPMEPTAGLMRLKSKMANAQMSESVPDLRVTFSAGMASYENDDEVQEAIERADQALYRAKNAGRNQVFMVDDGT